MLSVYLDTNVWNFLAGQKHSGCEDKRPSWEMLRRLRRTRKMRIVSSPEVLQEIINASHRRIDRSRLLYKAWKEFVGTRLLREHADLIASEALAALKNRRFSPWASESILRKLRTFEPGDQDLREISDQSFQQRQSTVELLREIDEDLKSRVRKGAYVHKAPRVEIPRNTYALLRTMIPDIVRRRYKPIRPAQTERILRRVRAAYAFIAFLVASTAYRNLRGKRSQRGDFEDARHFSYGVYVDRIVTADSGFVQTSGLIPNSRVTMMLLEDFCEFALRRSRSP